MYSFEKYRRYFFRQFLADIFIVLCASGLVVFTVLNNDNTPAFKFFPWTIAFLLGFGLIRILTLLLWMIRLFLKKKIGLGLIAFIHSFILFIGVYGALILIIMGAGMSGITLDGPPRLK